ncbi:mechanosensitive ion channel family protein [Viscerimonas tarda]
MRYIGITLVVILSSLISSPSFAQKTVAKGQTGLTKEVAIDTIKALNLRSAPVAPFSDTLFYVYGDLGAVGVKQRAHTIEKNIIELEKDPFFDADSLHVGIVESDYNILYIDKTIMSVNDRQSKETGKSKAEIAKEYTQIIVDSIRKEKEQHSWQIVLKQIGLSILILAVTGLCLRYLIILFSKLRKLVKKQKGRTIKKLYTVIDADKQISLLLWVLKVFRLIGILIIICFCLFTFFRLFPETVWLSDRLIDYILTPLKKVFVAIKTFIPDLFYIIIIILIFRYLIKAIRTVADKIHDGAITINGFFPDWAIPTYNIVRTILYIFMFILIFPHLPGSDSPVFQGVSVFMGILFSLGSTSVISNMVSGLVITYMRPFKVGDRIKMGEFLGNVVEKTPLVTRIKTPKNELITIPNANIMTAQTINYTTSAQDYGLILYETITMGYETPWRKVHEALIEAATNTRHVLQEPKPYVLQTALDDFYVEYQINVYTKEANEMPAIYSDLNKNIQDVFNREGLELLSPHYRTSVKVNG